MTWLKKNNNKDMGFFEQLGYPERKLHATLVDTDKYEINMKDFEKIQQIVHACCYYGTDFIMIGGSTGTIEQVAFCKLAVAPIAMVWGKPVILFPHSADDVIGFGDKNIQNKIIEKLKLEIRTSAVRGKPITWITKTKREQENE